MHTADTPFAPFAPYQIIILWRWLTLWTLAKISEDKSIFGVNY